MSEKVWQGRPGLAALVRVLVAAVPLLAGIGAAVFVSHLLPRPGSLLPALLWWAACFAISSVVMAAVASQARRLLPLATLLKLSMVFPDQTPSRFAMALRAGTIGNLKARLEGIRDQGIETEVGAAAETILILSAAMNAHDKNTRGHAERVRAFTEMLGEELGLDEEAREKLRWSSLLHDVGKVMVDPHLLNKTGPLDDDEWAVIHRHPDDGARIAAPLKNWLGEWSLAIEQHHEKYDGTGYPRQLAGEEISYAARIVAVADAFEVMTAARSYKTAMSPAAARRELIAGAGTHFDPAVVRAFVNLNVGRLRWIMGPLAWITQIPLVRSLGGAGSSAAAAAGGAAAVATSAALGLVPAAPVVVAADAPPAPVVAQAPAPAAAAPAPGAPVTVRPRTASQPRQAPGSPAAQLAAAAPAAPAVTTAKPAPTTRVNGAPIARDDRIANANPSAPVSLSVLDNDTDPDGDALTVTVISGPTHGSIRGDLSDGQANYLPADKDAPASDALTYRACDPTGACDTAMVTITF